MNYPKNLKIFDYHARAIFEQLTLIFKILTKEEKQKIKTFVFNNPEIKNKELSLRWLMFNKIPSSTKSIILDIIYAYANDVHIDNLLKWIFENSDLKTLYDFDF